MTCVTVVFKADGSFLRDAASQAKHGQVCGSDMQGDWHKNLLENILTLNVFNRGGERPGC